MKLMSLTGRSLSLTLVGRWEVSCCAGLCNQINGSKIIGKIVGDQDWQHMKQNSSVVPQLVFICGPCNGDGLL